MFKIELSYFLQHSSVLELQDMVGYLFLQQFVSAKSHGSDGKSFFQQLRSFLSQLIFFLHDILPIFDLIWLIFVLRKVFIP